MEEYSRITIEEYCSTHSSAKSRQIKKLLEMSYRTTSVPSDSDALFLQSTIEREKNEELREALIDLDEYLFGY